MVKTRTILDKKRIGIMIGQIGIGIIAFPWVYVCWNESNYDISFWEWFFSPPIITYNDTLFKKSVQMRVLWFVIQVTT